VRPGRRQHRSTVLTLQGKDLGAVGLPERHFAGLHRAQLPAGMAFALTQADDLLVRLIEENRNRVAFFPDHGSDQRQGEAFRRGDFLGRWRADLINRRFGAAYLVGLTPTLVANTINAGSPFSTTYGPSDIVPLDLSFAIAKDYISDMQGVVIVAALAWAAWALRSAERNLVSAVVITNLVCNLLFFLSHPIFTPYYLMPIAMPSLWSLLFLDLMDGRALSEDLSVTFQPHTAQS
jgi:hypothetical protein